MKILKICIISFFIILLLSQNIFALGEIREIAKDWEQTGSEHVNQTMNTSKLQDVSGKLYNIFLIVATGIAVIVGAILGIQFMTAGVNKKVEVKESLFPYLISCIIVFGSLGIWKLVVTILKNVMD